MNHSLPGSPASPVTRENKQQLLSQKHHTTKWVCDKMSDVRWQEAGGQFQTFSSTVPWNNKSIKKPVLSQEMKNIDHSASILWQENTEVSPLGPGSPLWMEARRPEAKTATKESTKHNSEG